MNEWTLKLLLEQARRRKRPLVNTRGYVLFVLALAQMAWASTFKKVGWASHEISKLVQLASHFEEGELPVSLDDLSRFYAEGPSRCRFNPYLAKVQSYLLALVEADFADRSLNAVQAMNDSDVDRRDGQPNYDQQIHIIISKRVIA